MDLPFGGRPEDLDPNTYAGFKDMFRSDHYRFWNYGESGDPGLPAIMIGDTGKEEWARRSEHLEQTTHLSPHIFFNPQLISVAVCSSATISPAMTWIPSLQKNWSSWPRSPMPL